MDIDGRISEIKERLDGAMPTKYEPDFEHEIWFIHHLREIIKGYREDVPWLIEQVTNLHEQRDRMKAALTGMRKELASLYSLADKTDKPIMTYATAYASWIAEIDEVLEPEQEGGA